MEVKTERVRYRWKFVPFIPELKQGVFGLENASSITRQLHVVVEKYEAKGWDFVRLEQVNTRQTPGCLAALFGGTTSTEAYDVIVFRAERGTDTARRTTGEDSPDAAEPDDPKEPWLSPKGSPMAGRCRHCGTWVWLNTAGECMNKPHPYQSITETRACRDGLPQSSS